MRALARALTRGLCMSLDSPLGCCLALLQIAYLTVEGGVYYFLSSSAAPVHDAQGNLVSGGADLASPVR